MRLAPEDVVECAAADEKAEMATVGVSLAVAVVDEDLDAPVCGAAFIGAIESASHDAQHSMPRGDVVERGHDFGDAQLGVIQVDVRASAVAGKKTAVHVLRIPGPVAWVGADSRETAGRGAWRCGGR